MRNQLHKHHTVTNNWNNSFSRKNCFPHTYVSTIKVFAHNLEVLDLLNFCFKLIGCVFLYPYRYLCKYSLCDMRCKPLKCLCFLNISFLIRRLIISVIDPCHTILTKMRVCNAQIVGMDLLSFSFSVLFILSTPCLGKWPSHDKCDIQCTSSTALVCIIAVARRPRMPLS